MVETIRTISVLVNYIQMNFLHIILNFLGKFQVTLTHIILQVDFQIFFSG